MYCCGFANVIIYIGQWSTGHVISQSPDYVTLPDWRVT